MTAYTRCPDCRASRTVATTVIRGTLAEPRYEEEPQPCPQCDGTGCVPFQGYVLVAPEEAR